MKKNYTFNEYLFSLEDSIVASGLLNVLHFLSQIIMVIVFIIMSFTYAWWMFIMILPGTLVIRFSFEILGVVFAINRNLSDIRKSMPKDHFDEMKQTIKTVAAEEKAAISKSAHETKAALQKASAQRKEDVKKIVEQQKKAAMTKKPTPTKKPAPKK